MLKAERGERRAERGDRGLDQEEGERRVEGGGFHTMAN
jgi:hypothetical protein